MNGCMLRHSHRQIRAFSRERRFTLTRRASPPSIAARRASARRLVAMHTAESYAAAVPAREALATLMRSRLMIIFDSLIIADIYGIEASPSIFCRLSSILLYILFAATSASKYS